MTVIAAQTRTATGMAFRDQLRRPLVPILIILVPLFLVLNAVAETEPSPRLIELPGGAWAATTMKALHGPEMAKFSVAFVAALVGAFVMRASLQGDRRLVAAGLRRRAAVLARLLVLTTATAAVVAVAAVAMRLDFTPASWPPVLAALLLTGVIYAAIGALAGALLDKLAATYLILFLATTDLGVVQTPMFHATPARFAWLLPGYAPTRLMLEGAYSHSFDAAGDLLLSLVWAAALAITVYLVLRRRVGVRARTRDQASRPRGNLHRTDRSPSRDLHAPDRSSEQMRHEGSIR